MDRETISALTHADLPFANPLSEAAVEEAIGLLAIPAGGTALDVGCGNGEILARVKRRHDVTTMGIEPSPRWAAAARERVDVVHAAPLAEVAPMEAAWDLVVCIASSHAFGSWSDALFGLRRLVRDGGRALVGEGFWRRPPSPGFLEALGGATADELPDHDGLLAGARANPQAVARQAAGYFNEAAAMLRAQIPVLVEAVKKNADDYLADGARAEKAAVGQVVDDSVDVLLRQASILARVAIREEQVKSGEE